MGNYSNIRKAKAIEKKNIERWKKTNSELNNDSGIYVLCRTDDDGITYFYVGQAKHILSRLAQHMTGYQHIDLSLKKRGLFDEEKNPDGWEVHFTNFPLSRLDEMEQFYIKYYMKKGYQCRYNKTSGSQGKGKEKINEFRPAKGYRDGLKQGKITLARELSNIIDKHLVISLKKPNNKVSEKQFEKFKTLLNEDTYKD